MIDNISKELNKYLLRFIKSLKNSNECNKEEILKHRVYDDLLFTLAELEQNLADDIITMERIYKDGYALKNTYKKTINIKDIHFVVECDEIIKHCSSVALHLYIEYTHEGFGRLIMGSSAVKVGLDSYLYDPILDYDSALKEIRYFLDEHNKNYIPN